MLTGAVAVGPESGEWLQQLTLAIRAETPIDVLLDVIQPYPTFSEGVFLGAARAEARPLDEPAHGSRPAVSSDAPSDPSRSAAAAPANHDDTSRLPGRVVRLVPSVR